MIAQLLKISYYLMQKENRIAIDKTQKRTVLNKSMVIEKCEYIEMQITIYGIIYNVKIECGIKKNRPRPVKKAIFLINSVA